MVSLLKSVSGWMGGGDLATMPLKVTMQILQHGTLDYFGVCALPVIQSGLIEHDRQSNGSRRCPPLLKANVSCKHRNVAKLTCCHKRLRLAHDLLH